MAMLIGVLDGYISRTIKDIRKFPYGIYIMAHSNRSYLKVLKINYTNRNQRGVMMVINEDAVKLVIIEVKLHVNQRLFEQGYITEEMYTKAKEIILKVKIIIIPLNSVALVIWCFLLWIGVDKYSALTECRWCSCSPASAYLPSPFLCPWECFLIFSFT